MFLEWVYVILVVGFCACVGLFIARQMYSN